MAAVAASGALGLESGAGVQRERGRPTVTEACASVHDSSGYAAVTIIRRAGLDSAIAETARHCTRVPTQCSETAQGG